MKEAGRTPSRTFALVGVLGWEHDVKVCTCQLLGTTRHQQCDKADVERKSWRRRQQIRKQGGKPLLLSQQWLGIALEQRRMHTLPPP